MIGPDLEHISASETADAGVAFVVNSATVERKIVSALDPKVRHAFLAGLRIASGELIAEMPHKRHDVWIGTNRHDSVRDRSYIPRADSVRA